MKFIFLRGCVFWGVEENVKLLFVSFRLTEYINMFKKIANGVFGLIYRSFFCLVFSWCRACMCVYLCSVVVLGEGEEQRNRLKCSACVEIEGRESAL